MKGLEIIKNRARARARARPGPGAVD